MSTEQQILEAAIEEFAVKGFSGARTAEIAARAGVTHAMLHYYFRTKQQLFEHIVREKFHLLMDLFAGALTEPGTTIQERLARGVGRHFDFVCANPYLPKLMVSVMENDAFHIDELMSSISAKISNLVTSAQAELDAAAARGEIAPVSVIMLLSDIVSLNIFPFFAPKLLLDTILPMSREEFLAAKRQENIETILKRIRL